MRFNELRLGGILYYAAIVLMAFVNWKIAGCVFLAIWMNRVDQAEVRGWGY